MLEVTGFGVRNLRALRDTGWIQIRPINILVGRNSAGKSTLARLFPLLKQSAERRKQSPILWYGRLVDFGSFSDVIGSFAETPEIEIKIRLESSPLYLSRRLQYRRDDRRDASVDRDGTIEVALTLTESSDGRTQLSRLRLKVFGVDVEISFTGMQVDSLRVGETLQFSPADGTLTWTQGSILPIIRLMVNEPSSQTISDEDFAAPRRRARIGEDDIVNVISHFVHGNTQRYRKIEIADRLPLARVETLYNACTTLAAAPDTWRTSLAAIEPIAPLMSSLQQALVLYNLQLLMFELDEAISVFCNGISYLEPLRATAQRYYRREELSVDELDPKGLNTAFLIQSLNSRDRDSLNAWLKMSFGFQLAVKPEQGHLSLKIQVDDDKTGGRNMADVGLGYSQLAPVAIQLWAAQQARRSSYISNQARYFTVPRRSERPATLVVVEQPELHLHPAFQSKLADIFTASVSDTSNRGSEIGSRASLRIIAETHSPGLINRLGELVEAGRISPNDINVLLFEPDPEVKGATQVRVSEFDTEGVLQNWPIGFLDS